MNLLLFLFLLEISLVSGEHLRNLDDYDWMDEYFENITEKRRLTPDQENMIPPDTPSKSANLFFANMLQLISKNTETHMEQLGAYSTEQTQILLCEGQKAVTFAGLGVFVRKLHHIFKEIEKVSGSFRPSDTLTTFSVEYKGITYENKAISLKWNGEAKFDAPKKVFIYTKLSLSGDCSGIPDTLPEHPTQPLDAYIGRLKNAFMNEILTVNPRPTMSSYTTFTQSFLFSKVRVNFCEQNGKIQNMFELNNYLFKRYEDAESLTEQNFSKSALNDYQTDVTFSVKVNFPNGIIMRDRYLFRIEERRNKGDESGWVDWWTAFLVVDCPDDLTPTADPKAIKDKFIGQVCGSISPMINDGASVESRTTFLSHMMKEEHQGFWALLCGLGSGQKFYKYFSETYLSNWSSNYVSSELVKTEVEDYTNFAFKCTVQLKKSDGVVKKTDFRMKAYYELDKWLVKEVRVECEY